MIEEIDISWKDYYLLIIINYLKDKLNGISSSLKTSYWLIWCVLIDFKKLKKNRATLYNFREAFASLFKK